MQGKLDVLGFAIDKNELYKSITKVNAMVNALKPKNFEDRIVSRPSNILFKIFRKSLRTVKTTLQLKKRKRVRME